MIEKIKHLIKEELGILFEVSEESKKVFDRIVVDLQKVHSTQTDVCYIKTNNVQATLNNIKFKVNYTYRNFFDKSIVDNIGEESLTEGGSAYLSDSFIMCNINIFAINGTINKQMALSTIQHELEHIYQQIRNKKRIPGNDMRYAKMRTDLYSSDPLRQEIGRIVYACYKSEQEGFINGTYAWCMADDCHSEPYNYQNILKSPAGKLLNELKTLYQKVSENKEMQNILQKEYKLSLKQINDSINQFIRRLSRVLIKVNNDKSKFWRI